MNQIKQRMLFNAAKNRLLNYRTQQRAFNQVMMPTMRSFAIEMSMGQERKCQY